jgi:hemolysin-activating ACP:hemolysin acyltransferase
MSTSQVVNSALQPNGMSASAVDGLKATMARDLSAQLDAAPAMSSPPQGKPTGLTEKVRRDAAVLRNALAFTQLVGVLMRSPHYRKYTLGDLEWLVIPPLKAGQFRIGEAKLQNNQGPAVPVAVVLWASVSPEVDKRLMEGSDTSFQLKPEDWKSGDILWLLHAAGETRFVRVVVDQLTKTTFKGRKVKVRGRDRNGNLRVHVLEDRTSGEPSSAG